MKITIEVDSQSVLDVLNRLQRLAARPKPVLLGIGEKLIESTKARFAAQTAPDGSQWVPNSPVTIARKGKNKPPLTGETGTLMSQINYQLLDDVTLRVGSPEDYAAVQQFGAEQGAFGRNRRNAPIPWGDIPARPFLGVSESDEETILDAFARYLRDQD